MKSTVFLTCCLLSMSSFAESTWCNQMGDSTVCNTYHSDGSMDQSWGNKFGGSDSDGSMVWNKTYDATGTRGGPYYNNR